MRYTYKTKSTCTAKISFNIDENAVVKNIVFTVGCNGNLKAIRNLTDGWTAQQISDKLLGNTCGGHTASCSDQPAAAVPEAVKKERTA